MIFLKLFIIFTKIGTFNFGGGYAMLSLIHNEVVVKNAWLTNSEFTDIVAISQSTPGPIGINAATYAGYVAVLNQGYPQWLAVAGSVLASLSIIWLPFIIMILISRYLLTHKDSPVVKSVFSGLRPAIIGLLTGKCARRDGKAAGGEEQRRIALMIQFGGIFRRFGVAVAGDKEDICLLWLIAQKDEARDVVDPFKHGVEPFRPAGRRACRRRKRCAQPETGTAGR